MERIIFLERNTFRVEFRRPNFPHEWVDYPETSSEQVVARAHNATILICNKLDLREKELSPLNDLKLIAVAATGIDNIDLPYCRSRGIAVCNTRNYAMHSLPEHVLLLILALRRNLLSYVEAVRCGEWQRATQFTLLDHPIHDLHGSKLGIIGYGFLGRAVAQLAEALGMEVLVAERKGAAEIRQGRISFSEVLSRSDVITLHCPLTPETMGLMAEEEFRQMKPGAVLINTARGGLIKETALVQALKHRVLGGAAVDVLSKEPPQEGNVLLDTTIPNLIITPHISWASREAMQTLADQLVENLEAFVRGEPKNLIKG